MKIIKLWLIFVALLAIVAVVWFIDDQKGDSTFDAQIIKIDSASVNKITIKHPGSDPAICLTKENGVWMVTSGEKAYPADSLLIPNILRQFSHIQAERLVSREKSKQKDYELTDSLALRVTFYKTDKVEADVLMGKFSYTQRPGTNPKSGNGVLVSTYLRSAGENEIYAIPEHLKGAFHKQPNDYRNKQLVRIKKQSIKKMEFHYPADSSFVLQSINNKWFVDNEPSDSIAAVSYLGIFGWLSGQVFLNDFEAPEGNPAYSLSIVQTDGKIVEINAWPVKETNDFAITSSTLKNGTFFSGKPGKLFNRIFKNKESFLVKKQKKK